MTKEDGQKPIPMGLNDFKEIRDKGYYYVDKTEFISEYLSDGSMVELFTRPRGFGKSLNLSMMDAFFNMKYKGNTWFDGLKVSEHEETLKHKNAYPVINIDLSRIKADYYEEFLSQMGTLISNLIQEYDLGDKASDLDPAWADFYVHAKVNELREFDLDHSLVFLCDILHQCYGVKPVVLIDNYDYPLNRLDDNEEYKRILRFLMRFYESALKGNPDLNFAVLTGVLFVIENSIYSGFNNVVVKNIFRNSFDDAFGFTESEVREICDCYGHPEKYGEAEEWYSGYRFGDTGVYFNPLSIANYVGHDFKPRTYWGYGDNNGIIDTLMINARGHEYSQLQALAEGGTLDTSVEEDMSMRSMSSATHTIISVMVAMGYLSAVEVPRDKDYYLRLSRVSIPNLELRKVFSRMVPKHARYGAPDAYGLFFEGLEKADTGLISEGLREIRRENVPFFFFSEKEDYPLVLLGFASVCLGRYKISVENPEKDSAVVRMKSTGPGIPNIVFEIKKSRAETPEALKKSADKTLSRIKEKQYYHDMTGRTILYGIAPDWRDSAVSVEELEL